MNIYSKTTNTKLKILGIYQLIGGLLGVFVIVRLVYKLPNLAPAYYLLIGFIFLLYIYSIFCGILVLRNAGLALKHSLINQYVQLVNFYIAGYGFAFIAGSSITAGVDLTKGFLLDIHFTLLSDFNIQLATDSARIGIYINVIALVIIVFIDNLNKKMLEEKEKSMIAEIGTVSK